MPDRLDQLVARHHGIAVFNKIPKNVKDLGLDVHRCAGNRQLAETAVEHAIGELVNHGVSREYDSQFTPESTENQRSLEALFKRRRPPWAILEADRNGALTFVPGGESQERKPNMKTMRSARTTALTGIAGAVVVAVAAGPAMAGHGLLMKENPLRGDFPIARDVAGSISAELVTTTPQSVARQRVGPGGWLRGDFPLAAENRSGQASPEPATVGSGAVVARGVGETWSCTVQTASAQAASDPTPAVMRVIHLPQ